MDELPLRARVRVIELPEHLRLVEAWQARTPAPRMVRIKLVPGEKGNVRTYSGLLRRVEIRLDRGYDVHLPAAWVERTARSEAAS
jgi:hypothetical protein